MKITINETDDSLESNVNTVKQRIKDLKDLGELDFENSKDYTEYTNNLIEELNSYLLSQLEKALELAKSEDDGTNY